MLDCTKPPGGLLKMSCGKHRRWHFQDPKFKNFLGIMPLDPPKVWGTFGSLIFLPVHAPSKSHTMPLISSILSLMKSVPNGVKKRKTNYLKTWSRRGFGGGGVHFKNCYFQGGFNFDMKLFWGAKVLMRHTFLKTLAHPPHFWEVINNCFLRLFQYTSSLIY